MDESVNLEVIVDANARRKERPYAVIGFATSSSKVQRSKVDIVRLAEDRDV